MKTFLNTYKKCCGYDLAYLEHVFIHESAGKLNAQFKHKYISQTKYMK